MSHFLLWHVVHVMLVIGYIFGQIRLPGGSCIRGRLCSCLPPGSHTSSIPAVHVDSADASLPATQLFPACCRLLSPYK